MGKFILPGTIIAIGALVAVIAKANAKSKSPKPTTTWMRYRAGNS